MRGWLSAAEGQALAALAAGQTVLEIGSYCGRSTICLAQTARVVYALDWHQGDPGSGYRRTLTEFLDNIRRAGVENRIVPLVGRVEQLAGVLGTDWADLAFVDGAHDYASAVRDARLALSCLKPGGTLALHDYGCDEGVNQAVRELLAGGLELIAHVGTVAVLRRSDAPAE